MKNLKQKMLTKSYKDYLLEAEQSPEPQPGDYLHVVTEDGITHIQLDESAARGALTLLSKIPGVDKILKKLTKGKGTKKGKVKDKVKKGAGAGTAAGAGFAGGSLLGGGGGGNVGGDLFQIGYQISSNQFVGSNPIVETLNAHITQTFPPNISHFILDLR